MTQEKEQYRELCEQAEATKQALTALQGSLNTLRGQVQADFRLYLERVEGTV